MEMQDRFRFTRRVAEKFVVGFAMNPTRATEPIPTNEPFDTAASITVFEDQSVTATKEFEKQATDLNLHVMPGLGGHSDLTNGLQDGLEKEFKGKATVYKAEYPVNMGSWITTAKETIKSDPKPWILFLYSASTVVGQVLAEDIMVHPTEYPSDITLVFMYPLFAGEIAKEKMEKMTEQDQTKNRAGGIYSTIVKEPVHHNQFNRKLKIVILASDNDTKVPFSHAKALSEATGAPIIQLPKDKDRGHFPASRDVLTIVLPIVEAKLPAGKMQPEENAT